MRVKLTGVNKSKTYGNLKRVFHLGTVYEVSEAEGAILLDEKDYEGDPYFVEVQGQGDAVDTQVEPVPSVKPPGKKIVLGKNAPAANAPKPEEASGTSGAGTVAEV